MRKPVTKSKSTWKTEQDSDVQKCLDNGLEIKCNTQGIALNAISMND